MNLSVGPGSTYEYLARVVWLPAGELVAQVQDRRQRQSDLLRFDPRTGQGGVILHEAVRDLDQPHRHLSRLAGGQSDRARAGSSGPPSAVASATSGSTTATAAPSASSPTGNGWSTRLAGVDEAPGAVYFVGTEAGPTERHLYQVPLAGGQPRRITVAPGWHTVKLDHSFRRFVDTHESLGQPPRVTLRSLDDDRELAVVAPGRRGPARGGLEHRHPGVGQLVQP